MGQTCSCGRGTAENKGQHLSNQHAPDEHKLGGHMPVSVARQALGVMAGLYRELGAGGGES